MIAAWAAGEKQCVAIFFSPAGHPALAGWYGCDDCCNKGINKDTERAPGQPTQLYGYATVRETLRRADPYHLVVGTVACGEVWLWTEAGAGTGLDVAMLEVSTVTVRDDVSRANLVPSPRNVTVVSRPAN